MTFEQLEYEVRRLPGVIAAAADGDSVAVLVLPTVDADALSVVVRAMLAAEGVELPVRIVGGMTHAATRPRRTAPVMVGAAGGVGVLASIAVAAAMTGNFPLLGETRPAPVKDASRIAGPAQADGSTRPRSGRVVVPGPSPDWAAGDGAWPLPAALPDTTPSVPAPVVIPAPRPEPVLIPQVPIEIPQEPTEAPVVAVIPPATPSADEPGPTKEPQSVPRLGGGTPAGAPAEKEPSVDAVGDDDGDDDGDTSPRPRGRGHGRGHGAGNSVGHEAGHDDHGRHLGWQVGPAHANPRSSADSAPRGGRK